MSPRDFFNNLDPGYRKALVQLKRSLERSDTTERLTLLQNFGTRYMMSTDWWDKINCPLQFCIGRYLFKTDVFKRYDREMAYVSSSGIQEWLFPCKNLKNKFSAYEKNSNYFPAPETYRRYERIKLLYHKIKHAAENETLLEWFNALTEAEDIEFVKENVEFELGKNLCNKELWKLYLRFLQDNNDFQALVDTFAKYCRFFLDDFNAVMEYKRVASIKGKVPVPWINPFDFEVFDENFFDKKGPILVIPPPHQPISTFLDPNDIPPTPNIPFQKSTVLHLLEKAPAEVLMKIFYSSKWLYTRMRVSICYKLEITRLLPNRIVGQSIRCRNPESLQLDNIFIANVLIFYDAENPNSISHLLPKIYRCTAKYVNIFHQNLSKADLFTLIGGGCAKSLQICAPKLTPPEIRIEDVLGFTPQIERITLVGIQCTRETSSLLSQMKFEKKIVAISFFDLENDYLKPEEFAKFIQNNCADACDITLFFAFPNKRTYVSQFSQIIGVAIQEKWPIMQSRPKLNVR